MHLGFEGAHVNYRFGFDNLLFIFLIKPRYLRFLWIIAFKKLG